MAAALPDRTWHSISGYLSHPVCPLLTLQHPSNRALSAFAHWKRNVGLVRLDLNGDGFLCMQWGGLDTHHDFDRFAFRFAAQNRDGNFQQQSLCSETVLSALSLIDWITTKVAPRTISHYNNRDFLNQDHLSNPVRIKQCSFWSCKSAREGLIRDK